MSCASVDVTPARRTSVARALSFVLALSLAAPLFAADPPPPPALIDAVKQIALAKTDAERKALFDAQPWTPEFKAALRTTLESLSDSRAPGTVRRPFFTLILDAAKAHDDKVLMSAAELGIGSIDYDETSFDAAFVHYKAARELAHDANDAKNESSALFDLAITERNRGNIDEAVRLANEAIPFATAANDDLVIAKIWNALASIELSRGHFDQALIYSNKAIPVTERTGKFEPIYGTLLNMGNIYRAAGDLNRAQQLLQRVVDASEKEKNLRLLGSGLNNLAGIYKDLGEVDKALETFKRSLALKEQVNDRRGMVTTLENIGTIYRNRKQAAEGFAYYQRALKLATEMGETEAIARISTNLAFMGLNDDAPHFALYFATYGAEVAKVVQEDQTRIHALTARGDAEQVLERYDAARKSYEEALALTEAERKTIVTAQARQGFLDLMLQPYLELVHLMYVTHDGESALRYAEAAKARVLLDVLQDGKFDRSKVLTADERSRENQLQNVVDNTSVQLIRLSGNHAPASKVRAEQQNLEKQRIALEGFEAELHRKHPELSALRGEVEFAGAKTVQAAVDANTALLEHVVGDEATFVIVATRGTNGKVRTSIHAIQIDSKVLAKEVQTLRTRIANRDLGVLASCAEMFDKLVGPAWNEVKSKARLVIVPDGALWELPFQALRTPGGKYVIEQTAVSYAPSITSLAEMHELQQKKAKAATYDVVALGNSQQPKREGNQFAALPEAERQIDAIGKLYRARGERAFVEDLATKATLMQRAGDARILHVATHGVFNDDNPMYSYLVLAKNANDAKDDGTLEAWEISKMNLRSSLVVLSACETARGRPRRGEGLIGMTWALFVAGSPSTVTTQWKVDSESTTSLMVKMHEVLAGTPGVRKSSALRQASLSLMRESRYRHPFYWAPFVLVGDDSPVR